MKSAIIALVITIGIGVAFIGGMVAQSTGWSMGAMCLAPFALIYLGWSLRGININISIGERESQPQQRQPQQRPANGVRPQTSALKRLQTQGDETL